MCLIRFGHNERDNVGNVLGLESLKFWARRITMCTYVVSVDSKIFGGISITHIMPSGVDAVVCWSTTFWQYTVEGRGSHNILFHPRAVWASAFKMIKVEHSRF